AEGKAERWGKQAIDALLGLKKAANNAITGAAAGIDPAVLADQQDLFRQAALVGMNDHRRQTSKLGKKLHALAARMHTRIGDYLRFAHDPHRVPFDNNAAPTKRHRGK